MSSSKGKLIVIEACDGSGKATQAKRLYERLLKEKYKVRKVEYPNYDSESSALIKMYLNGKFGSDPEDVNPYAASTFYAVDRYASYKTEWKEDYDNGYIILADRYTTSNMVHQASKIHLEEEKEKYLNWLTELEFELFKLPEPDIVIFLNMPPEYSKKLMEERVNKFTGKIEKDIHEKNQQYLNSSYINACKIADKHRWCRIDCVDNDKIKSIDEINKEIYEAIKEIL